MFPNQKMFYVLIGTYSVYFVGQAILVGNTLFIHIRDGDIYTPTARTKLLPAKSVMNIMQLFSELALLGTMYFILGN